MSREYKKGARFLCLLHSPFFLAPYVSSSRTKENRIHPHSLRRQTKFRKLISLRTFIYSRASLTGNRMSIQNLNTFDPFADAIKGSDEGVQDGFVHIRIQQRNGRKTLTTVQGLSAEYDLKKIVRACKKEFACNGTVVEHPEYGEVLQLQGDQRENICQWLTKTGLAKPDQLKVHGF